MFSVNIPPPDLAVAFFFVTAIFLAIDLFMGLLMPAYGELRVDVQYTGYSPFGAASILWNWKNNGRWRKTHTNHAYSVDTQNDGSAPWRELALRLFKRRLYKEDKK